MKADIEKPLQTRPVIGDYQDPVTFMQAMIEFRKATEKSFSVSGVTAHLRRVSPTLVSLIVQRKRKITLDRVEELAKLLDLNSQEKFFFKNWLQKDEPTAGSPSKENTLKQRKEVSTHILQDWINVYVKDSFQIPALQKNPHLIHQAMGLLATAPRIDRAIQFLLTEGHLRKTLDGRIVVEANLAVADPKVSNKKIRQFHKGALGLAKSALDLFPTNERFANTLIVPLNEKSYAELMEIVHDFAHKLQDFAAANTEDGDRLYQLILNLSPTGGKLE